VEAGEVDIADGDLATAFEGEGDGCCSADAWDEINIAEFSG
jgi:hypothetical protein